MIPVPGYCAFCTPESGIGFFRIPNAKTIFSTALCIFWFYLCKFQIEREQNMSFDDTLGSGMAKNQHPGSGIKVHDLQHCLLFIILCYPAS